MKLTIDTQSDSKDDIRKAIKLLMGLVGSKEFHSNDYETVNSYEAPKPAQSNIFDNPEPAVGNFMNMFDTPSTETPQETAILPQEAEDDIPQVEFF